MAIHVGAAIPQVLIPKTELHVKPEQQSVLVVQATIDKLGMAQ